MRTPVIVIVLLLEGSALMAEAGLRKQCRLSCGDVIEACVAEGGKRRACKRRTLKQCRHEGIEVCVPPAPIPTTLPTPTTTTTTTPGATTTTRPCCIGPCPPCCSNQCGGGGGGS